MEMLRRYPLVSALAILAAVLLGVLAIEYGSSAALHERVAGAGKSPAVPVQTRLLPAMPPVNPEQEYAEMGARPLFIPTRRPAPALAQAASGSMAKGQFTLTAVMSAGETKIALLREKASGRVVRVEQGKDVNGITVSQIDREQVTLTQGGDSEVVPLLVAKGAPQPAPLPAPVPAAAAAGPFGAPAAAVPGAAPVPQQPNPTARAPSPVDQGITGQQQGTPRVNPNSLFGPRPPGPPVADPTTATPPTSQAAPLTPEELLARRRARRNQQ